MVAGCSPIDARDPFADAGAAPLPELPGTAPLEIGDRAPAFELRDHRGDSFDLTPSDGTATVLTFFESRSPEPTLCPELLNRLAALDAALHPDLRRSLRLVALSVDPDHDNDEVLTSFAADVATSGGTRMYARAEPETISRVTAAFGVLLWERGDGSIGHTLNTIVLDRRGRFVDQFPGVAGWSTADLLASASVAAGR